MDLLICINCTNTFTSCIAVICSSTFSKLFWFFMKFCIFINFKQLMFYLFHLLCSGTTFIEFFNSQHDTRTARSGPLKPRASALPPPDRGDERGAVGRLEEVGDGFLLAE